MDSLSSLGRLLAVMSTLSMGVLICNAVIRFSATTSLQWALLFAFWLLPAAGIVLVEGRTPRDRGR